MLPEVAPVGHRYMTKNSEKSVKVWQSYTSVSAKSGFYTTDCENGHITRQHVCSHFYEKGGTFLVFVSVRFPEKVLTSNGAGFWG